MKNIYKRFIYSGLLFILIFILFTCTVQIIDLQTVSATSTRIGFATINKFIHSTFGVHMNLYILTDYLSILPLFVCLSFAFIGIYQMIKRKSIFKVDSDILFLGIYYITVVISFIIFEYFPVNYRPILIDGCLEASYPSSTTLLVISVMNTFIFQLKRRIFKRNNSIITIFFMIFTVFIVGARLISGVHWFTDIIASIILSIGLFNIYKGIVLYYDKKEA